MSEALFGVLDRVIDTRTGEKATVVAYGLEVGDDGYALVVEYDAEPDVKVSTGSSYFRRDPSVHWEMADNHRHVGYWDSNDGTTRCRNCGADLGTNE